MYTGIQAVFDNGCGRNLGLFLLSLRDCLPPFPGALSSPHRVSYVFRTPTELTREVW